MIAGLCAFGLRPRATLEIPSPTRRLDRILELLAACRYSFHDLSRVQLSGGAPRFNMPFEVGLAVATARWRPAHQWFLLEARPYRMVRTAKQPALAELWRTFQLLSVEATGIRRKYGTLFGARAFKDLVVVAVDFASREGAR